MRRILTRKSIMNFGKHSDRSVQQVIDIHKESYIIWCYCHLSNISFCDEILDSLGIPEDDRIPSGETNPDKYQEFVDLFWKKLRKDFEGTEDEWMHLIGHYRSFAKRRNKAIKDGQKLIKHSYMHDLRMSSYSKKRY